MITNELEANWPELQILRWLGNDLGAVRDQGPRETCLAFATSAAHEHHRADGRILSPEYLSWGAKQRDGLPHQESTTVSAILAALEEYGQSEEQAWPYDAARSWPSHSGGPPDPAYLRYVCTSRRVVPKLPSVIELLNDGAVPILVVEVTTGLINSVDGRILAPDKPLLTLGNHAVVAVGYGEDGHGQTPLIIRNSWGADWGVGGYGQMPERYVEHHLRTVAVVG